MDPLNQIDVLSLHYGKARANMLPGGTHRNKQVFIDLLSQGERTESIAGNAASTWLTERNPRCSQFSAVLGRKRGPDINERGK